MELEDIGPLGVAVDKNTMTGVSSFVLYFFSVFLFLFVLGLLVEGQIAGAAAGLFGFFALMPKFFGAKFKVWQRIAVAIFFIALSATLNVQQESSTKAAASVEEKAPKSKK